MALLWSSMSGTCIDPVLERHAAAGTLGTLWHAKLVGNGEHRLYDNEAQAVAWISEHAASRVMSPVRGPVAQGDRHLWYDDDPGSWCPGLEYASVGPHNAFKERQRQQRLASRRAAAEAHYNSPLMVAYRALNHD